MNITFEMTPSELASCFSEDANLSKPFEIKIGSEVFTCYVTQYSSGNIAAGWSIQPATWVIQARGESKRLQDIANAKALVNKTKEAHKEAQRRLAELQEKK